ncbi:hypothetical protein QCA50_016543 [Cerrena zonata]|uniref:Uncharacterized protein n=1 Tax=Cerrena zonata TaxID=2478898 RepID=A0AAW0FF20_9APHY
MMTSNRSSTRLWLARKLTTTKVVLDFLSLDTIDCSCPLTTVIRPAPRVAVGTFHHVTTTLGDKTLNSFFFHTKNKSGKVTMSITSSPAQSFRFAPYWIPKKSGVCNLTPIDGLHL